MTAAVICHIERKNTKSAQYVEKKKDEKKRTSFLFDYIIFCVSYLNPANHHGSKSDVRAVGKYPMSI